MTTETSLDIASLLRTKPSPYTDATYKTYAKRETLTENAPSLSLSDICASDSDTTQDTLRMIKSPWTGTESWPDLTPLETISYENTEWTSSITWNQSSTTYYPKSTSSSGKDTSISQETLSRTVTLLKGISWSWSKFLRPLPSKKTVSEHLVSDSSSVSHWSLPRDYSPSDWGFEDYNEFDALRVKYPWSPQTILSQDMMRFRDYISTSAYPSSVFISRSLQCISSSHRTGRWHRNARERRTIRCANVNNKDVINAIIFTGNCEVESTTQYVGLTQSERYVDFWLKKLKNVY